MSVTMQVSEVPNSAFPDKWGGRRGKSKYQSAFDSVNNMPPGKTIRMTLADEDVAHRTQTALSCRFAGIKTARRGASVYIQTNGSYPSVRKST